MRYTITIHLAFIGLALSACNQQQKAVAPGADWVLTNGKIYTVDEERPWAEAIVIKDGKFVYVGDNAGAESYKSEGVEATDLGGRMVIPGLVDAHTHPGQIDLTLYEATFEANTRETFMAELEAYAQENQGDGWLRGCCWPTDLFVDGSKGPDRVHLDPIFPDRPVWLKSSAGHSFWLNSVALKQLGISDQTYYRWRKSYGGMKVDQAKRLKELAAENARLKRAVADLTVDKLILKEVAEGKY